LETGSRVHTLNLSHAAGTGVVANSSPVNFFLEQLWKARALQKLEVCANLMDFKSCLIFEDAVEHHKQLRHINVSDNQLGLEGLRSLFKALTYKTNALRHLEAERCWMGREPDHEGHDRFYSSNLQAFDYELALWQPYHRSVLRMLYKAAERFDLKPADVIRVVPGSPTMKFEHGTKNADGIWEISTEEELKVEFDLQRCLSVPALKDLPPGDFDQVLRRVRHMTLHRPAPEKIDALFAFWKGLVGNLDEQELFLKVIERDFMWSLSELEVFASVDELFRASCITHLLPTIEGDRASRYLGQMLYFNASECLTCRVKMKKLLYFNIANPTGHYVLDLENSAEFAVAESLQLIDKWEILIDGRLGHADVSATCNKSHARNEIYQVK